MGSGHDALRSKRAIEPDPEWIVPDRVYAPGYESRPRVSAVSDPADRDMLWDDLWRGGAILILIGIGVASISSVIV